MSPERWRRYKQIFQAAEDLPQPQRADYVRGACGDDEELCRAILSLLGFRPPSEDFLSQPAADFISAEPTRDVPQAWLTAGEVLARRYQIVRLIGRGGMGEVYEARDLDLEAAVAVKLVRPEIASRPEVLERFKREVYLARQVTHSNVCRIFDLGYHQAPVGRLPFLTMELLSGETLAERIARSGPLGLDEAFPLVMQMAGGLAAAHAIGVIHRDFKSANLMLTPQSVSSRSAFRTRVTIMDFGLARIATDDSAGTRLTGAGMLLGTPAYMAPEQIEGGRITPGTDIYALGVVLYEMVTGALPFEGDNAWIITTKRLREAPRSPRSRAVNLDKNWDAVILKCLARDPAARFQTATEVQQALSSPSEQVRARDTRFRAKTLRVTALALGVLLLGPVAAYYLLVKSSFLLRRGADDLAGPKAAVLGWHRMATPPDELLSDVRVAAGSLDPLRVLLFGPSFVRSWEPGQSAGLPLALDFPVADRAECESGLWLIHEDKRHLTRWDPRTQLAAETFAAPSAFVSGVCLDDAASRWGFLVNERGSSRWIEFDARANRTARTIPLNDLYARATIDPPKHLIALVGNTHLSLRRPEALQEVFRDSLGERLVDRWAGAWSESGRYFAAGFKQLAIYDVIRRRRVRTLTITGWISGVGWIGDEGVSAMDDRGRLYWTSDLSKGWQLEQEPASLGQYAPFWIPSHYRWLGSKIVGQGAGLSWAYITPPLQLDLPVSPLEIWSIAVSADDSKVAVSGKDPRIFIVDRLQRKTVHVLQGHTDGVTFVRFDGPERLISASDDKSIRLWDTASGTLLKTASGHESLVNAFAISPNKQWLVSVSSDKKIKLWRLPELRLVGDIGVTAGSGAAASFRPNDDNHLLISDWQGKLYLYEGQAPDWSIRQQAQLPGGPVYMLCPGGNAWWAARMEGGLWRIPADDLGKAVRVSQAPAYYCATTDDGQLTAVQFANRIEVRSNAGGDLSGIYRFTANIGDAVTFAHGPALISGFRDGRVLAWQLERR